MACQPAARLYLATITGFSFALMAFAPASSGLEERRPALTALAARLFLTVVVVSSARASEAASAADNVSEFVDSIHIRLRAGAVRITAAPLE